MKSLFFLALSTLILAQAWAGPVNINKADAETLARELNGIGLARAQAIVAYRDANGRFASAEDLMQVEGVGPGIVESNREQIQVEDSTDR